jgi:hypothetical protein
MIIGDTPSRQCGSESIPVELGIAAGAGQASHVHDGIAPMVLEQVQERFDRPGRMAYRG